MPVLSEISQRRKADYFLRRINPKSRILEVGAGSGWVGAFAEANGWTDYVSLDIEPGAADIIGDITNLEALPLSIEDFDVILAFEVLEHVDLIPSCEALLKPGGWLMLTTPLPQMDWLLRVLEMAGLNQRRTSPHTNLTNISTIPGFRTMDYRVVAGLAQWGVYEK